MSVAPPRLSRDRALLGAAPSPDPAMNLYTFLRERLRSAYDLLGCAALLNHPNTVAAEADA